MNTQFLKRRLFPKYKPTKRRKSVMTHEQKELLKECTRYGIKNANDLHNLIETLNDYNCLFSTLKFFLDHNDELKVEYDNTRG